MSSTSTTSTTTQPSSILFFIAIAIGVVIALVFIFFSLRYYVRTKLGIYATARLTTGAYGGGGGVVVINGDFPLQQLNIYNHDLHNHIRAQRRRRRYMKKRRLTEQEVDHLFPVRTYHDWLDGGAERDIQDRDIMGQLKEENDEVITEQVAEDTTDANNHADETTTDTANATPTTPDTPEVDLGNPYTEELHYDTGTCAICIDTYEPDDMVRGLICGHVFHQECLDPWLTKRKACCPMCKRDYYMKNDTEEEENNDADSIAGWPELQYTTLEDRVEEILQRNPELETIAREKIKVYRTFKWRLFWLLMGISKKDLLNCTIASEDERRREYGPETTATSPPAATDSTEEEVDLSTARPGPESTRETVERMV